MIQDHHEEQKANQQAESAFVRKELWNDESASSEDMAQQGHTILGDYHPPQVIVAGQSSGTLTKVLAGAAIAAGLMGIPAAGIIGYGVSQWAAEKTDPKPVATEDTSLDIGLGRFEDLLPE